MGQCSCGCGCNNGCYNIQKCCTLVNGFPYSGTVVNQNSFNIPAVGSTATINVPYLKSALVGGCIWNPTYGYFEIVSFDALLSQMTIRNNGVSGNASPGTIVPACTSFQIVDTPLSEASTVTILEQFAMPTCGTTVSITAPFVQNLIPGVALFNPTFGFLTVTSFNSTTKALVLTNDCKAGNAAPGTTVPAGTSFIQAPLKVVETDVTWTPVLVGNGLMTVTAQTIYDALLFEFNDNVFFRIFAGFTIGGTPNTIVNIPLPFAVVPYGASPGYVCTAEENFGTPFQAKYSITTSPYIAVYHESLANWAAGGGNIGVSGFVKKA